MLGLGALPSSNIIDYQTKYLSDDRPNPKEKEFYVWNAIS